jgi:uncharacterized protein (DUF1015 family)
VPVVRPFRALRYDPERVALAAVIAPPYDVVSPDRQAALLGRDPRNVIRLELPPDEPGDPPDARYRRAARTLAAWRSDGTLRKDPRPSVYVYEQTYCVPGTSIERTQRGVFARLRLEPFGPDSGVRPHERTLAAPREDRYRLLRATGTNVSPVVGLVDDASRAVRAFLDARSATEPAAEATDDDGVRHRMWVVPDEPNGELGALTAALGAAPITIADGHHRYETALRYRDERRMTRSCEEDPAFDYVLALLLSANEPLTVLPTHRIVRGLGPGEQERLRERLPELFDVQPEPAGIDALARGWLEDVERGDTSRAVGDGFAAAGDGFAAAGDGSRGHAIGFVDPGGAARLRPRQGTFAPLVADLPPPLRRLDVVLLRIALERLLGIGADEVAAGRVEYTHDALDAARAATRDGDAAFLLPPTPVRAVIDVAAAGDVMPQKSTYFYPKAATGLVLNPHEW